MSATQLFHQDGKPAGVWYCSECKVVFLKELSAAGCHGTAICACGKEIENPRSSTGLCRACDTAAWDAKTRAAEAQRFEKAEKVAASRYDGPIYAEGVGPEWFASLDEYLEYANDHDVAAAPYVWAAKDVGVRHAELEDVTEWLLEGMWEDADQNELNGIADLAVALAAFNDANESVVVWNVDYTRAIVLQAPLV